MEKQTLVDKLEKEYEAYTGQIALLPPREIISRADVIAGYYYVLQCIKSDDFDLSGILEETGASDLDQADGLLEDIYELFRYTTEGELDSEVAEAVRAKCEYYCGIQDQSAIDNDADQEDDFDLEP